MKAYLDIETSFDGAITVIGLHAEDRGMIQLVGGKITDVSVWRALDGINTIYTYNGSRFDLPVIRRRLGLDLAKEFRSHDLMYDCWRNKLKGGLKAVERQLGIERHLKDVDGFMAVRLWFDYVNNNDHQALATLLEYNREDVANLLVLRRKLNIE